MEDVRDPISETLRVFNLVFNAQYSPELAELWTACLRSLTLREIEHALGRVLSEWTKNYPPTPGQFISLAKTENGVPSYQDEAILSEFQARSAIKKMTRQHSLCFSNAIISETIRTIGLSNIRNMLDDGATRTHREFSVVYIKLKSEEKEIGEYEKLLYIPGTEKILFCGEFNNLEREINEERFTSLNELRRANLKMKIELLEADHKSRLIKETEKIKQNQEEKKYLDYIDSEQKKLKNAAMPKKDEVKAYISNILNRISNK